MSTTTTSHHEEYTKRERIFNALAVYPDRYQVNNQVVAEVADASRSYVYQLRSAIEDEEISDDEIQSMLSEDLQTEYREQIGEILESHSIDRVVDENTANHLEDPETPVVPVESVREIREIFVQYRRDADFERTHFEGPAVNLAHEKYLIADQAVTLLDQVLADSGVEVDDSIGTIHRSTTPP